MIRLILPGPRGKRQRVQPFSGMRMRGHWAIENRSHHVRDVTLGEDASRIRKGSGPEVMAAIRNATIGLLRLSGASNIAAAVRRNASRIGDLFTKLGILKQ
jgi:hypothetical protein